MRRVFDLDVLACPRCGGRLRLIATVQDPGAVRTILAHLGLPLSPAPPRPGPTRAYRHRVAPRAGGAYGSSLSPGASRPPLTVRPSPEQAMIDGVR